MSNSKNKQIAFKIIEKLHKNKNSLSVTLTGSYSEHFNPLKAGDIDIVIVCKKLNKKYFDDCISKLKHLKKKYFGEKSDLIINSTFGPIKFYKKNTIVFHLMIYEIKSHIYHTINSPFTCYDWERSKIYVGKSLKSLSPVYKLQLKDFTDARRSVNEYLSDILRHKISYREYEFNKNNIKLKKKYFKIDKLNERDFIYHIIKYLIINIIKYENNNNIIATEKDIEKKFYRIVNNSKNLRKFIQLRELKKNKSEIFLKGSKFLVINFLKKFDKYIQSKSKNCKVFFSRHKKTRLNKNIFLGQKLNPKIINKENKKEFLKVNFNQCFSSPSKRCIETAEINFDKNNIITNNNLKEIDYGHAEGLTLYQFQKKYPKIINKWKNGFDPKFPNGESSDEVLTRLKYFIRDNLKIYKSKKNKKILVISHNVVLRTLIGSLFNIKKKYWFMINIPYFDLLEFDIKKGKLIQNFSRKKYLSIFENFYKIYNK